MAARRTRSGEMPDAFAIASSMIPSRAPCRSSPTMRRFRKSASSRVARENKSSKSSRLRRSDPGPDTLVNSSSLRSTSRIVRLGVSASVPAAALMPAYPTPSLPCRVNPERKDTAISASSGASSRRSEAISSVFSSRFVVSRTRPEVATRLASNMKPVIEGLNRFCQEVHR